MNLDYNTLVILAIGELLCETEGVGSPGWVWYAFVLRMCDFYMWVPHVVAECARHPEGTQLSLEWP
jgi:hypothetical protein